MYVNVRWGVRKDGDLDMQLWRRKLVLMPGVWIEIWSNENIELCLKVAYKLWR